jgi:hypothetical protein
MFLAKTQRAQRKYGFKKLIVFCSSWRTWRLSEIKVFYISAKAQRTQRLFGLINNDFDVLGELGAFARVKNIYNRAGKHKEIADDRKRDREVDCRYRGTNSS